VLKRHFLARVFRGDQGETGHDQKDSAKQRFCEGQRCRHVWFDGHPSDELFPQGTGEIHEFSAEDLVSVGPKPDAPEYYARFREIMASQYPTIQAMQNVTPPTPGGTFEQRYSKHGAAIRATSGPPIVESPDKARTSTLQKSTAQTRLAKLARLEELVTLLALYAGGNDEAGAALGIR